MRSFLGPRRNTLGREPNVELALVIVRCAFDEAASLSGPNSDCVRGKECRRATLTRTIAARASGPRTEQEQMKNALRIEQIVRRRVIIGQYRHIFGQRSVEIGDGNVLDRIRETVLCRSPRRA